MSSGSIGSIAKVDVLSILTKLGVEFTAKISLDRATKKLTRYIEKNGELPTDLSPSEKRTLHGMGIEFTKEEPAKKTSAKKKAATKKTPAKKKAATKKTSAKKTPEETPKKAEKKTKRVDWMTCAATAVLNSSDMDEAGKNAAQIFRDEGGKVTPNTDQNGWLYASFASKALIVAGVIELDGKTIIKL